MSNVPTTADRRQKLTVMQQIHGPDHVNNEQHIRSKKIHGPDKKKCKWGNRTGCRLQAPRNLYQSETEINGLL